MVSPLGVVDPVSCAKLILKVKSLFVSGIFVDELLQLTLTLNTLDSFALSLSFTLISSILNVISVGSVEFASLIPLILST